MIHSLFGGGAAKAAEESGDSQLAEVYQFLNVLSIRNARLQSQYLHRVPSTEWGI